MVDLSQEEKNVQCCTKLAQEGQYRKAQQALVSSGMAEYNAATIKEIQEKHPPASLPPMPASDIPPGFSAAQRWLRQPYPFIMDPLQVRLASDLNICL